MTRYRLSLAAVLFAALVGAAADGPIRLPVAPPLPSPMPQPVEPGAVLRLGAEELYAVESDVELADILTFPDGLVSFEKAAPGTFFGKFAGAGGRWGRRELKGPFVYLGTAVGKGRASVAFVPVGVKTKADIVRTVIDADSAAVPSDDKKTDPKPEPKQPVAWVVVVEESGERTAATAKVLGDLAYWQGLKAKGIDWRFYDKDSPDAKVRNFDTFAAEVGVPAVLFLASDGKKVGGFKLPATVSDIDAKLKEHGK